MFALASEKFCTRYMWAVISTLAISAMALYIEYHNKQRVTTHMAKKCNVVIKRTVYEPLKSCPFPEHLGIREMARMTGFDASYLSRVKRGLIAVTEEQLQQIEAALAKATV